MNLSDWLGDHPWSWWLLVAVLLFAAELVDPRRRAVAGALGSLVACVVAALVPALFWVQVGLGAAAAVLLGWLAPRPPARDQA